MCSLVTGSQMPSAKHLAFRDAFVESEEVKLVMLSGRQLRALKRSPNANQVPSGHPPEKCFYLPSWPQVLFPLGKGQQSCSPSSS